MRKRLPESKHVSDPVLMRQGRSLPVVVSGSPVVASFVRRTTTATYVDRTYGRTIDPRARAQQST